MHLVRALVEGGPQQGSNTPAQTTIGAAAALMVAANPKRKGLIIQNTGLTTIKIVLGTTDPTQTVYHVALKAAAVADDGSGSAYFDDNWIGPVRGISSGAGGTYVLTEITAAGIASDWDRNADWGAA